MTKVFLHLPLCTRLSSPALRILYFGILFIKLQIITGITVVSIVDEIEVTSLKSFANEFVVL